MIVITLVMDNVPFKEYFCLTKVIWNVDLLDELNSISKPPQCNSGLISNENAYGLNLNDLPASDPLDDLRFNAHDEFRRNGIECDMDEIDMYQHQMREVRAQADADENPAMVYFANKRGKNRKVKKLCVLCKNNGETADMYNSHNLKDSEGRVTCPVLRKYTCPLCHTNGDNAHTIKYCPKNSAGASPGLLIFLNSTRDSIGRPKMSKKEIYCDHY